MANLLNSNYIWGLSPFVLLALWVAFYYGGSKFWRLFAIWAITLWFHLYFTHYFFISYSRILSGAPELWFFIFCLGTVVFLCIKKSWSSDMAEPYFTCLQWFLFFSLTFNLFQLDLMYVDLDIFLMHSLLSLSTFSIFSKMILSLLFLLLLFSIKKENIKSVLVPFGFSFSFLFMLCLQSSSNFIVAYIALEAIGFSMIFLIVSQKTLISGESAIKYFIPASIGTVFILIGVITLFGVSDSVVFDEVKLYCASACGSRFGIKGGLLFIFVGLFIKIAVFPLNWWVADVYEGSWTPVVSFMATVSSAAIWFFILKLVGVFWGSFYIIQPSLLIISLISIVFGSVGALRQVALKRFLGYASVTHSGFILLSIACCNIEGLAAAIVYIVIYSFSSVALFSLIMEYSLRGRRIVFITDLCEWNQFNYTGAVQLTVVLFSMSGLPPFGLFLPKLMVFYSCFLMGSTFFNIIIILVGILSVLYYLYIIQIIWFYNRNIRSRGVEVVGTSNNKGISSLVSVLCLSLILVPIGCSIDPCLACFFRLALSCLFSTLF